MFNGMSPLNHREPGTIGAAYDSGVYVELISDGVHIHPSVVRAVFNLYSEDRICLISDSICACGMADGIYELGGQSIQVIGKSAILDEVSLAGSVTPLSDGLRRAVEFGVQLEKAIKAASINPAKSTGIDKEIGSLTKEKRADILILNKELELKKTIFGGVLINP
jgi:N-acetylglucosamine-6-phosphate deacetylase